MSLQLRELHAAAAQHHVEMAKCHDQMSKADGMEDSASDFHSRCRDSHTKMAEAYLKCAKADTGELDKTVTMTLRQSVAAMTVDPMFAKLVAVDEDEHQWR